MALGFNGKVRVDKPFGGSFDFSATGRVDNAGPVTDVSVFQSTFDLADSAFGLATGNIVTASVKIGTITTNYSTPVTGGQMPNDVAAALGVLINAHVDLTATPLTATGSVVTVTHDNSDPITVTVKETSDGNLNVEVAGSIQPGSYEISDKATRRFFVMRAPKLRGFKDLGDEDLKSVTDLPYAILNKERLSYVYDFN